MNSEVIGGYRILEQIGAGGMAKVYLAVHKDVPNLKVILKILSDSRLVERFKQEADKLAMLDGNPNICRIKHFFHHEDSIVIAMEYIDGVTLDGMIKEKGALPVGESLRIVREVLRVLEFAHEKGIYHRDIKPGNIMVDTQGNVKVIDFGIAKAETDPSLTLAGTACGTPSYMAPEQFTPSEDTNYSLVDIYAVGVTLYRMLSGRLPFEGDNEFAIRDAKLFTEPPTLREISKEIPRELDSIVMRSLAKNPSDRFASTTDMIRALEEVLSSVEGPTEQPAVPKKAVRKKRNYARVLLAAVAVFVMVAVTYVVLQRDLDSGPGVPALLSPANGAVVESRIPSLVWKMGAGEGDRYQLEYADDPGFLAPELVSGLTASRYRVTEELGDGQYFWRVQTVSAEGDSSGFSEVFNFTVSVAAPPPQGNLLVNIVPRGDIYLDDELIRQGAERASFVVDSGSHRLIVRNESAVTKEYSEQLTIVSDTSISLAYQFRFPSSRPPAERPSGGQQVQPSTGELMIGTRIGSVPVVNAAVYIDGELQGRRTPSTYQLQPGTHIIRGVHTIDGVEREVTDTVVVTAGSSERLILDFD